MVAVTDVAATGKRSPRVRGRPWSPARLAVDAALALLCGGVVWALLSRSLLLTAAPVAVGVLAAAVAALRSGSAPRRSALSAGAAASLVVSVLLSSPRIWAPDRTVASAFLLLAATCLASVDRGTASRNARLMTLVTATVLAVGPVWAIASGDAAVAPSTAFRTMAVALTAASVAASPPRPWRSSMWSLGLVAAAVAGADRFDARPIELLAITAVLALLLERWWRDADPIAHEEGWSAPSLVGGFRPHMIACGLMGGAAWVAAISGARSTAVVEAAGVGAVSLLALAGWQETIRELRRRVRSLERIAADVARRSQMDRLTGLPNRDAFEHRLGEEIERALRHRQPLALLFIDIDHFKSVNDSRGHAAGDDVLAAVAATLRAASRTIDFVARYGGEEFVVIAPATWSSDAVVLAGRLRGRVSALRPATVGSPLTISVGVAGLPEHAADAATLLLRADQALYESKRSGRDRTSVAGSTGVTARG